MQREHYSLARRILFPYSGKEPLTRMQGLRVILTWALLFPLPLLPCSIALVVLEKISVGRAFVVFLLPVLAGALLFGLLGWIVVSMNNRSVRILQTRNAKRTDSTRGGRYGS